MTFKSSYGHSTGVYADDSHIKKFLSEKYGSMSISELKENKEVVEDLIESDICMTVRLQIVYGRLSVRSVRNAFEESVGNRLQRFGGADNKELLQRYTLSLTHTDTIYVNMFICTFKPNVQFNYRFTSQFKDEYKISRGSFMELSRDKGHILRTTSKFNSDLKLFVYYFFFYLYQLLQIL